MTEKLRQVVKPVLPIWRDSTCDRQERELLFGERFTVQSETGGFGYGYAEKDGYCGFVDVSGLGEPSDATHMVSSFGSHIYPVADIKSASPIGLSFGSRLKMSIALSLSLLLRTDHEHVENEKDRTHHQEERKVHASRLCLERNQSARIHLASPGLSAACRGRQVSR